MASLDDPRAKLARAHEHLDALNVEVREFLSTQPYRAILQKDPQTGDRVYRLKVDRPPPVRLGVLVGDVAHNLRSCLDHLAWQLALITTVRPRSRTGFPIFRDEIPPDKKRKGFHPHGVEKILDLPYEAQKLIESIQPYQRRNRPALDLLILHEINNTDKHKITLGAIALRRTMNVWVEYRDSNSIVIPNPVVDDGDELLRVPAGIDFEHEQEPEFTFDIAVDIPTTRRIRWTPICTLFGQIYKTIGDDLLTGFERFFTPDFLSIHGPGF